MSKANEMKKNPIFEVVCTPRSVGQAVFIQAVVIPEIMSLLEDYMDDLKELESEEV